jgi:hypothetical protein
MSVFIDMVFGSRSGKKTKLGKGYRVDKNGKLQKIAPNASAKAKWQGSKRVRVARRGTPK